MVAYLDAGTGSMVIGALAAGAAGAGVAMRSTLGKFKRKPKGASQPEEQREQSEQHEPAETTD
jgi:hypothetical protein